MLSMTMGQMRPAIVPIPLDIPIKILAYLGAMSRWFTLNPVNTMLYQYRTPKRTTRNRSELFKFNFHLILNLILIRIPDIANPLNATPKVRARVAAKAVRA